MTDKPTVHDTTARHPDGRPRTRRWWRGRLPIGLAAVALSMLAVPAVSAGAAGAGSTHSAATGSGAVRPSAATAVRYATVARICPAVKAHQESCDALALHRASKSTPGAHAYVAAAPDAVGQGPAGGLTPADLATAYGYNPTGTGTGQTVAIVDAYDDPNIAADLATFDKNYGLAACTVANGCLKKVNQSGATSPLPAADKTGWSVEETLDVETVHAVCQECKILLVEATSPSNANLAAGVNAAVTLKATEVSNSYGGPESGDTAAEIADYNHPGTVITASTADDGYYDFDLLGENGDIDQPDAPAALPTVVAIGGTSLSLTQTGTRSSETVWNSNGPRDLYEQDYGIDGATGGGCSTVSAAKGWQTHVSDWASTDCGTKRLAADVSAVADPFTGFDTYDSYSCSSGCLTGWNTIGGTSLASPLIASVYALAGGAHGVAYPALTPYGHLGSTSLYDVTVGGNGYCDGEGAAQCGNPNSLGAGTLDCDYPATGNTPSTGLLACDAGKGYDGPTGVGTPAGLGAFAATGPKAVITAPASVPHATAETFSASTSTDPFPGGSISSYVWAWGDGTTKTTTTVDSAKHTFAKAGTFTVTLTETDDYGVVGSTTRSVKVT